MWRQKGISDLKIDENFRDLEECSVSHCALSGRPQISYLSHSTQFSLKRNLVVAPDSM
jgi:hypothetical protein